MTAALHRWRTRHGLTQVQAASILGVSQPYLSLLEKGLRPLTPSLRNRLRETQASSQPPDRLPNSLSALGYQPFAHLDPTRPKPRPHALLASILSRPDVDARVVEALPWLVRRYVSELDLPALVREAKQRNLQNRLGFLLAVSGAPAPLVAPALAALTTARLLAEATLCWDSMPAPTRDWLRARRSPLAAFWNILSLIQAPDGSNDL